MQDHVERSLPRPVVLLSCRRLCSAAKIAASVDVTQNYLLATVDEPSFPFFFSKILSSSSIPSRSVQRRSLIFDLICSCCEITRPSNRLKWTFAFWCNHCQWVMRINCSMKREPMSLLLDTFHMLKYNHVAVQHSTRRICPWGNFTNSVYHDTWLTRGIFWIGKDSRLPALLIRLCFR